MAAMLLTPGLVPLADWRRVLIEGGPVELDPACRAGVERGAAAVGRALASGDGVYGVNTGFGKLASVRIANGDLAALQRNLILSHCAGFGPDLPDAVVRLVLAMKAASLARGASGVRFELIGAMLALIAAGAMPVIPAKGSVGASGDLAPLAHLTAAMMGEGDIRLDGKVLPAGVALERIGLTPVVLMPKEGLAFINGTQVSSALALAGLFAAARVFDAALIAGAMSVDALRGSDTPFDARIQALRGQPGQMAVAGRLRALLAGSAIRASHLTSDDRVQDPYSLRCQPQVMGACRGLLLGAARTLSIEANGVTDNPLVMEDGAILSGGNFHAAPVALAADTMALAMAGIGNISERRTALLMDPVMSGLPAFLSRDPGLGSGLMIAQVTAAALASENKERAAPASIDTIPTSAGQEDHVSMATHAALRLTEMADNLAGIVAIELIAAAEAIEHHRPLRTSATLEAVQALIRARVPPLLADRAPAPDIAAVADLVRSGAIGATAGLNLLADPDAP